MLMVSIDDVTFGVFGWKEIARSRRTLTSTLVTTVRIISTNLIQLTHDDSS